VKYRLLSLALALVATPALPSTEVPDWIVPVLRLVSVTHVQPTTGIVISADGLVLVPADFAAPGDEIVVLDGGTDIVRNGRPGRLERSWPELGLELLRVEGLSRHAAPLAAANPVDGSSVRLRAFPPAEQITEGAAPVDAGAQVTVPAESGTPAVSAETPLPNVTGALLDDCGNLVGLSLANGVQAMVPDSGTHYRWAGALQTVLTDLGLAASAVPCGPGSAGEPAAGEPAAGEPAAEEPAAEEPAAEEPAAEEPAAEEPAVEEPAVEEPAVEEPVVEEPTYEETQSTAPASPPSRSGWWLLVAAVLLAGALAAWWRRRKTGAMAASPMAHGPDDIAPEASEEQPRWAPPTDCVLILRGGYADGRPLEASAAVNSSAINLEIGRTADLNLDSPSVSRRHARLNGTRDALTLTDLGSSNGSSINGVPCLEGETLFITPGDTVVLGDARFTIGLEAAEPSTQS